jgi:hypothetical protein
MLLDWGFEIRWMYQSETWTSQLDATSEAPKGLESRTLAQTKN